MTRLYEYDDSFEGLLTAIARALDDGPISGADMIPHPGAGRDLFARPIRVEADPRIAAALVERIARVARDATRRLTCAYLDGDPALGRSALVYVAHTLERARCVDGFLADPDVRRVVSAARRVTTEAHRLKGLLRFRELGGRILWAPVEPDADVLLPLALHFRARLPSQRWIIHDLRRHAAVEWDTAAMKRIGGDRLDRRLAEIRPEEPTDEERACQDLWRTFFQNVAVPERRNPLLQRRNMPRRYWKHLVEK